MLFMLCSFLPLFLLFRPESTIVNSFFRLLCAMLIASFGLLSPLSAFAQQQTFRIVFQLPEVGSPPSTPPSDTSIAADDRTIIARGRAISTKLAALVKKRLETSRVKDFSVKSNPFDVTVTLGGRDAKEPKIFDLLTEPGRIEIRAVQDENGYDWRTFAPVLPPEVEIRGDSSKGHLWSAQFQPLHDTLLAASMLSPDTVSSGHSPPLHRLIAAPSRFLHDPQTLYSTSLDPKSDAVNASSLEGWRSIFLGPIIASHNEVEKASWTVAANGTARVIVSLLPSQPIASSSKWCAILVDGQLLSIIPSDQLHTNQITLLPSSDLSQSEKRLWVRWVAGLFSASIPIPFAVAKPS